MTDQEIVIIVAEKVMGWKLSGDFLVPRGNFFGVNEVGQVLIMHTEPSAWWVREWNPLHNDVDSFMVVDKIVSQWQVSICSPQIGIDIPVWTVMVGDVSSFVEARHSSRCRAICIAALKASGIEVE